MLFRSGKVNFAGFLPPEELADLIAISDAVILPFRLGGGEWNTSIHGAVANRAYVITTSKDRQGFDVQTGVHYAPIDDVGDMKSALALAPQRRPPLGAGRLGADVDAWRSIARTHFDIYQRLLKSQVRGAN